MLHYGLEFEFFVLKGSDEIIPAYKATSNLDGNPAIGELRSVVSENLIDCVFDIQKKIHIEKGNLEAKGCTMSPLCSVKVSDHFLKELRASVEYTSRKHRIALEELSIYQKGTGKILPKGVMKTSLQVNISDNSRFCYMEAKYQATPTPHYESVNSHVWLSHLFNHANIINKFDSFFQFAIHDADRIPGVYAIKDGERGKRIEYRSLPSTINLLDLCLALK